MTSARALLKTFLGAMVLTGRMRAGLPVMGVLIVPLTSGVGMPVGSLGMIFCFALKRWEGDMSGISFVFRKAKRTVGLRSFVRMAICLCEGKGREGCSDHLPQQAAQPVLW